MEVQVRYRDSQGNVSIRKITPVSLFRSGTEYALEVFDEEIGVYRTFAMKDILEWGVTSEPERT